jgi:hypothetical protein
MGRYSQIPTTRVQLENSSPIIYKKVRYPSISLDSLDIYLYVTQGDRYDTLAQIYYSDSNIWWIISLANPSQGANSLTPSPGSQIRIPAPSRISNILAEYNILNRD